LVQVVHSGRVADRAVLVAGQSRRHLLAHVRRSGERLNDPARVSAENS